MNVGCNSRKYLLGVLRPGARLSPDISSTMFEVAAGTPQTSELKASIDRKRYAHFQNELCNICDHIFVY